MSNAYSMRRAAFQAVRGWSERSWRIETSIRRIQDSQGLQPRDIAAATDIAATVIKRIASLDVVLAAYCSRGRERVESELWTLAQVGVAQLLFRPDIPPHAAVHETVGVADEIGKPQWKSFLNGLLRGIARSLTFQESVSFVEGLRAVATQQRSAGWAVFDKPLVDGDPTDSQWLSRVFSFPRWMTRRWLEADWHDRTDVPSFLRASNSQPRQWVRANRIKTTRESLVDSFRQKLGDDVVIDTGDVAESICVTGHVTLSRLPGLQDGACSIQDLTAMRAVDRLSPMKGERILDMCAAPGGKTCHIAERLRGTGEVVAADISTSRLKRVAENVSRNGLGNVTIADINSDGIGLPEGLFDAAMVDVPCTNTGVLAKRPEVRWRIKEADLEDLPETQFEILTRAASRVRSGGRLVYSTCSVENEENRQVVDRFVTHNPQWTLRGNQLELPTGLGDGGYHALLVHNGE